MIAGLRVVSSTAHRRGAVVLLLMALLAVLPAIGCEGEGSDDLILVPALGGVIFDRPVEVGSHPDGRVLVAERGGRIWLVDERGDRALLADLGPIIEAERGEGLLSVALDPTFSESSWLWAYFFAAGEPWRTVLARFDVMDGRVDVGRGLTVLELPQPGFNQNGGAIRFGTDDYLYLSVGDGSASTDPFEQGQDMTTLLGTVLRIDVRDASPELPYRVPADNPFVGTPDARPEIFAYGLRNPWRMSIDPVDGTVWLGDVGFTHAEEVNRVEAGANFGWSILEGDRCLDDRDCARAGLVEPVYTYAHEQGRCAVIGGPVYRGRLLDSLQGRLLFGDLCTGELWALPADTRAAPELLAVLDGMLVSFGLDVDGEVLAVDHAGGGVYRLVRAQ